MNFLLEGTLMYINRLAIPLLMGFMVTAWGARGASDDRPVSEIESQGLPIELDNGKMLLSAYFNLVNHMTKILALNGGEDVAESVINNQLALLSNAIRADEFMSYSLGRNVPTFLTLGKALSKGWELPLNLYFGRVTFGMPLGKYEALAKLNDALGETSSWVYDVIHADWVDALVMMDARRPLGGEPESDPSVPPMVFGSFSEWFSAVTNLAHPLVSLFLTTPDKPREDIVAKSMQLKSLLAAYPKLGESVDPTGLSWHILGERLSKDFSGPFEFWDICDRYTIDSCPDGLLDYLGIWLRRAIVWSTQLVMDISVEGNLPELAAALSTTPEDEVGAVPPEAGIDDDLGMVGSLCLLGSIVYFPSI
ncbi:MAG: hypothetical protein LBC25_01805 [Holosporales bacterium]|nr:hypothetical protein [Holosporales bacterium]